MSMPGVPSADLSAVSLSLSVCFSLSHTHTHTHTHTLSAPHAPRAPALSEYSAFV